MVGSATLGQIRLGWIRKVAELAVAPRHRAAFCHSFCFNSCILVPALTPVLASVGYSLWLWVEVNLLRWPQSLFYHLNRKQKRTLSNTEPRAPGKQWHLTAYTWSVSGIQAHEISFLCLPYLPHTVHPVSGNKADWSGTAPRAILVLEPALMLGQTPSSLAVSSAWSFVSALLAYSAPPLLFLSVSTPSVYFRALSLVVSSFSLIFIVTCVWTYKYINTNCWIYTLLICIFLGLTSGIG